MIFLTNSRCVLFGLCENFANLLVANAMLSLLESDRYLNDRIISWYSFVVFASNAGEEKSSSTSGFGGSGVGFVFASCIFIF